MKDLETKAWRQSHEITPETLIKAYISLRDEYSSSARSNPASAALMEEKASILKAEFINETSGLDYAELNAKFLLPSP